LSLEEASIVPKPAASLPPSASAKSSSTIKTEEGSGSSLKRSANDDEDSDTEGVEEETESEIVASEKFGIASADYFTPGPASNLALRRVCNMRAAPPPILSSGLVDWETAGQLFDL
jgi:hypothetical protein